jgi:hypothetical protein
MGADLSAGTVDRQYEKAETAGFNERVVLLGALAHNMMAATQFFQPTGSAEAVP